ncbi:MULTISPECIES: HPr family phosphocarrier protein [Clostridium]|uniref:Phosphocarrier protein HPr n=1 Tax=Clostridium senegalense TaxID=1465809 RepID=A0A6M0H4E2_9CLOT|nr:MULTISPECIES: HPr family phosphocarrier protein [Clostridium]NEU05148.1 HPr family phosphocarrier protein [Clostridium senegalense]
MKKLDIVIKDKVGLHARPATNLVKVAQNFKSNIDIEKNGVKANCKSIIGILSIGASMGETISFIIEGEDELEAYDSLKELFYN